MPDADPPDPDAAQLFALFNEVGILFQLSSAIFEARLPAGMLVSQFAVLNHLIRVRDGRTPLDLARAFRVPETTMTHTLVLLERRGLVLLAPNLDDGRSKCVWITEAGRTFRAKGRSLIWRPTSRRSRRASRMTGWPRSCPRWPTCGG